MGETEQDWVVFHRVRFSAERDGTNAPLPGPKAAVAWRFYPASPIAAEGLRTNVSDIWGGFGIYANRADAEAVFQVPEDHLPFLDGTVEAYHALISPYAHRGRVKWRETVTDDAAFSTAASDPGGPLVVFTSAGYEKLDPEDLPRVKKFIHEVDRVQAYYATLPENIRRDVYSGAGVDGHDGITVSIWQSDAAMIKAAYKPGHHRDQMNYQSQYSHFDRSSFTRARIIASKGQWDGGDPVTEIA